MSINTGTVYMYNIQTDDTQCISSEQLANQSDSKPEKTYALAWVTFRNATQNIDLYISNQIEIGDGITILMFFTKLFPLNCKNYNNYSNCIFKINNNIVDSLQTINKYVLQKSFRFDTLFCEIIVYEREQISDSQNILTLSTKPFVKDEIFTKYSFHVF